MSNTQVSWIAGYIWGIADEVLRDGDIERICKVFLDFKEIKQSKKFNKDALVFGKSSSGDHCASKTPTCAILSKPRFRKKKA